MSLSPHNADQRSSSVAPVAAAAAASSEGSRDPARNSGRSQRTKNSRESPEVAPSSSRTYPSGRSMQTPRSISTAQLEGRISYMGHVGDPSSQGTMPDQSQGTPSSKQTETQEMKNFKRDPRRLFAQLEDMRTLRLQFKRLRKEIGPSEAQERFRCLVESCRPLMGLYNKQDEPYLPYNFAALNAVKWMNKVEEALIQLGDDGRSGSLSIAHLQSSTGESLSMAGGRALDGTPHTSVRWSDRSLFRNPHVSDRVPGVPSFSTTRQSQNNARAVGSIHTLGTLAGVSLPAGASRGSQQRQIPQQTYKEDEDDDEWPPLPGVRSMPTYQTTTISQKNSSTTDATMTKKNAHSRLTWTIPRMYNTLDRYVEKVRNSNQARFKSLRNVRRQLGDTRRAMRDKSPKAKFLVHHATTDLTPSVFKQSCSDMVRSIRSPNQFFVNQSLIETSRKISTDNKSRPSCQSNDTFLRKGHVMARDVVSNISRHTFGSDVSHMTHLSCPDQLINKSYEKSGFIEEEEQGRGGGIDVGGIDDFDYENQGAEDCSTLVSDSLHTPTRTLSPASKDRKSCSRRGQISFQIPAPDSVLLTTVAVRPSADGAEAVPGVVAASSLGQQPGARKKSDQTSSQDSGVQQRNVRASSSSAPVPEEETHDLSAAGGVHHHQETHDTTHAYPPHPQPAPANAYAARLSSHSDDEVMIRDESAPGMISSHNIMRVTSGGGRSANRKHQPPPQPVGGVMMSSTPPQPMGEGENITIKPGSGRMSVTRTRLSKTGRIGDPYRPTRESSFRGSLIASGSDSTIGIPHDLLQDKQRKVPHSEFDHIQDSDNQDNAPIFPDSMCGWKPEMCLYDAFTSVTTCWGASEAPNFDYETAIKNPGLSAVSEEPRSPRRDIDESRSHRQDIDLIDINAAQAPETTGQSMPSVPYAATAMGESGGREEAEPPSVIYLPNTYGSKRSSGAWSRGNIPSSSSSAPCYAQEITGGDGAAPGTHAPHDETDGSGARTTRGVSSTDPRGAEDHGRGYAQEITGPPLGTTTGGVSSSDPLIRSSPMRVPKEGINNTLELSDEVPSVSNSNMHTKSSPRQHDPGGGLHQESVETLQSLFSRVKNHVKQVDSMITRERGPHSQERENKDT